MNKMEDELVDVLVSRELFAQQIELAQRTLVQSSRSLLAFGFWLLACLSFIHSTPFRPLVRVATLLSMGVYAVTTWPATYAAMGNAVCLAGTVFITAKSALILLSLGKIKVDTRVHIKAQKIIKTHQETVNSLVEAEKGKKVAAAARKFSRRIISARNDIAIFLSLYPTTFSLGTIVRITGCIIVCTVAHLLYVLRTAKVDRPESIVEIWILLRERLCRQKMAVVIFSAPASLLLLFWSLPTWLLCFLLAATSGWVVGLIRADRALLEEIQSNLRRFAELLPRGQYMTKAAFELSMPHFLPIKSQIDEFGAQLRAHGQERLVQHVFAGLGIGWIVTFLACFSEKTALGLYIAVCAVPVAMRSSQVGVESSIILGFLTFMSIQGLVSGYIVTYHLSYPWRWIILVLRIPFYYVWFWFAVFVAVVQLSLYTGSLKARKLLFDVWVLAERSRFDDGQVEEIRVDPNNKDTILPRSLDQIQGNHRPFQVRFGSEVGIDVGGLRRQWAAILSRALVVPPAGNLTPMLRKWEEDSFVFDLNYEYVWAERMKYQHRQELILQRRESGEFNDSTVLESYRKLGMIFGVCLMEDLRLIRISKCMCKCLLRDVDSEHTARLCKVTWEDFAEIFPQKAAYMKNPETRQHIDYTEVSLPSEVLSEDFFTLETRMKDKDFHPPAEPSEEEFDELARTILMNNHVQEIRDHFKQGFCNVINCKLGELFSPAEIQDLLRGSTDIDIDDWEENTVYSSCSHHHPVIQTFWKTMRGLSQEEMQQFCEFATGQPTPPVGGFCELRPILFNIKLGSSIQGITAHSCINQIELPTNVQSLSDMKLLVSTGLMQRKNQLFNTG